MSAPENPQAFPYAASETSHGGHFEQNGMTLRDYFAGQCIGKLAALAIETPTDVMDEKWAAQCAYELADAMLAERSKGQFNG